MNIRMGTSQATLYSIEHVETRLMNITKVEVTEITILTLLKSTCYSFQVVAINSAGTGVLSNATIINTTEEGEF